MCVCVCVKMSSEHTTGPVPAENGSAEDEENETPAPQLNKPEPKHKKSQQDLHELVQKRFDQAELFLRDQLASHWKTGVYSASIARRPLPQCSNNDFYFVVRFSRPTEPHPIPSEAAQFRVHVWRGPDDTWDLEAQGELFLAKDNPIDCAGKKLSWFLLVLLLHLFLQ